MSFLKIQIVNDKDEPIGSSVMEEAWVQGLWHRIARIMVQSPDGSFLLQKRSHAMKTYPDCWDNSASGHVDENEDYLTAAKRELAEEIGIVNVELTEIGYYQTDTRYKNYQLRRFHKVYLVHANKDVQTKLQPEEVSDLRWFSKTELKQMLQEHPEQMSDGLQQVLSHCSLL